MSITEEERSSITALVEESEETAAIAERLCTYLQQDHKSVERMRALHAAMTESFDDDIAANGG